MPPTSVLGLFAYTRLSDHAFADLFLIPSTVTIGRDQKQSKTWDLRLPSIEWAILVFIVIEGKLQQSLIDLAANSPRTSSRFNQEV